MDRNSWLAERRAAVVADYDAMAATYHEYPNDAQQEWVTRLLAGCPKGGVVLDAPCGTGRYFAMAADAGLSVVGIDQSQGMLAEAGRRGIADALYHVGLQELAFDEEFDAVMTIDAMENVPPDHWPLVLANLRRAARPDGRLYMTVEETDEASIDVAYQQLAASGQPAVRGEAIEGDVAGYHYYPGRERVLEWFDQARLEVEDEAYSRENGWGYRHFLLRPC